jgi:hypothetical protein
MTAYLQRSGRRDAAILMIGLALSLIAAAETRAGLLPSDGYALSGFHSSTTTLTRTGSGGKVFNFHIEYAVYEKDQFAASMLNNPNLVAGQIPSDGNQYVYAYEVFNEESSNCVATQLSVGLDSYTQSASIGIVGDGGEAPSGTTILNNSAVWYFAAASNAVISPNNHSEILIFTSPFGPKWRNATIGNSAGAPLTTPSSNYVPSPVPEPATLLLLAITGAVFLTARVVRRMGCR